jgi:hypothetical protein
MQEGILHLAVVSYIVPAAWKVHKSSRVFLRAARTRVDALSGRGIRGAFGCLCREYAGGEGLGVKTAPPRAVVLEWEE